MGRDKNDAIEGNKEAKQLSGAAARRMKYKASAPAVAPAATVYAAPAPATTTAGSFEGFGNVGDGDPWGGAPPPSSSRNAGFGDAGFGDSGFGESGFGGEFGGGDGGDPFGEGAGSGNDLFGSPFGEVDVNTPGPAPAPPSDDIFGASDPFTAGPPVPTPAATTDDIFGSDPFTAPTHSPAPGLGASDPFGSDPFGSSPAPAPTASDPSTAGMFGSQGGISFPSSTHASLTHTLSTQSFGSDGLLDSFGVASSISQGVMAPSQVPMVPTPPPMVQNPGEQQRAQIWQAKKALLFLFRRFVSDFVASLVVDPFAAAPVMVQPMGGGINNRMSMAGGMNNMDPANGVMMSAHNTGINMSVPNFGGALNLQQQQQPTTPLSVSAAFSNVGATPQMKMQTPPNSMANYQQYQNRQNLFNSVGGKF